MIVLETEGFGVIVQRPSGVVWTNQTGGVACHHPEAEGQWWPLGASPFEDLEDALSTRMLDLRAGMCTDATADACDSLLQATPFRVDRARLAEAEEAWVPITWLGGGRGILCWENSD